MAQRAFGKLKRAEPKLFSLDREQKTRHPSFIGSAFGSVYGFPIRELFDGDTLGKVARLVNIGPTPHRDMIGQQLQRDDRHHRTQ